VVEPGSPRHRALQRLRRFERHRKEWEADRRRAISGRRLVQLAQAGRAHRFDLRGLVWGLTEAVGAEGAALCAWVLATERGLKAPALVSPHKVTGPLLGISERKAGDVVRSCVLAGLIEDRPHFEERPGGGNAERSAAYCATPRLRQLAKAVGRRDLTPKSSMVLQVGSNNQPTEKEPTTLAYMESRSARDLSTEGLPREGAARQRSGDRAPPGVNLAALERLEVQLGYRVAWGELGACLASKAGAMLAPQQARAAAAAALELAAVAMTALGPPTGPPGASGAASAAISMAALGFDGLDAETLGMALRFQARLPG
jgi:hypothetical protein